MSIFDELLEAVENVVDVAAEVVKLPVKIIKEITE